MNSLPLSLSTPGSETASRGRCRRARRAPFAGLVGHAAGLRPAGGDVGDGQRPGVLTGGVAAVVADQVDLDEPGTASSSPPVRTGIWLLSSEPGLVRERPSARAFCVRRPGAGRWWPPTCRQQRGGVVVDVQLAVPAQDRHQLGQHRRQPLAVGMPAPPAEDQRRNDFRPYFGRRGARRRPPAAATPRAAPCGRDRDATPSSRTTRPESWPYRPCPPLVAGRDRLRHRLALGHRQSHPPAVTQPSHPRSIDTPDAGDLK